jgi:hypothetical protein
MVAALSRGIQYLLPIEATGPVSGPVQCKPAAAASLRYPLVSIAVKQQGSRLKAERNKRRVRGSISASRLHLVAKQIAQNVDGLGLCV